MTQHKMRFTELACHVVFLVPTKRERVMRFIESLNFGIWYGMAQEVENDTIFHQVMEIVRPLEHICR